MPTQSLEHTLNQLDELKSNFGQTQARKISTLLRRVEFLVIADAAVLIRLHEILLFLRSHPHNAVVLKQTEQILRSFPAKISDLRKNEVDLSPLAHPEVSGIAGTAVIDTFGYQIVSWLHQSRPAEVDFYWDWFEDEARLAETWPRFIPLLEEDTFVEASVPLREWLRNARGKRAELAWLLDRFSQLQLSETKIAELYNAQKLYVRWRFAYRDSRTGLRRPGQNVFYQQSSLIQRRDVHLKEELERPMPALKKLSVQNGRGAIDMARAASTIRYRELYGFTNGDARAVYETSIGRGVDLVVITLSPGKRLPLRAYHSAMIYKNGVPIGYFEGLSLFERMESGFNIYYTFREGETAWLYARVLQVMHHLTGATAFSLDPYQIGFENEEGIASGAFWFYRKLGFRSTSKTIQRRTKIEEAKIATRKNYRTSAATLRRLSQAPMILELDETRTGDWDRFQVRNIGLAVQRLMAQEFGGQAKQLRTRAVARLNRILNIQSASKHLQSTLETFAITLLLIPDLQSWSDADKELLEKLIQAKAAGSEGRYLKLMQRHARLREVLIRIGSSSSEPPAQ